MATQQSDNSNEIEERAAIRQYDGGLDQTEAEQLALDDIKNRSCKPLIKQLRQRVSELTKLIANESDMQRSKELMDEWMRLRMQIIELRKEL